MTNHELATTEQKSGFLALADFQVGDALRDELVGLDVSFERIKIPSGGSTMFEVPGDESGETESVKEFSAVILVHHPLYAYYREKYTGGNQPPDCGSFDGISGIGVPSGACANCPYNQFGSGENGSKACKNKHRLYVLREGEIFPLLLTLPNGSLKGFSKYIRRLLSRGRKSSAVVTRFSLAKATNAGGLVYSQAQFAMERVLTAAEFALMQQLAEQVKWHSRHVSFDAEPATNDMESIDPETGEITRPL